MLIRIEAPYFVAGVEYTTVKANQLGLRSAPILWPYVKSKRPEEVIKLCELKGWPWEVFE